MTGWVVHATAAVRADALHSFTAALTRRHGVVVVEDLATKNLMSNRAPAQAIGDQGCGELGVRCCETQAPPRRTHPPLRRLRPGQ